MTLQSTNTKESTVHETRTSCSSQEVAQVAKSIAISSVLSNDSPRSMRALGKRKAPPHIRSTNSESSASKKLKEDDDSVSFDNELGSEVVLRTSLSNNTTFGRACKAATIPIEPKDNQFCAEPEIKAMTICPTTTNKSPLKRPRLLARDELAQMPLEIFHSIAMFLSPRSVLRLSHTCAAYRAGLDDDFLKQYICNNLYEEYTLCVANNHEDADHLCFKHQHAQVIAMDYGEDPGHVRQWFCRWTLAYCYHCDKSTCRINDHTGRALCKQHLEDPQYETIGVTRAKNEFLLTENDLTSLSYATAPNPIFHAAPRQRLYLLNQIREVAYDKHGDQLEEKLSKKWTARAQRKETRERKEAQREGELRAALVKLGLQPQRGKYTKCYEYIKKGKELLANVVNAVQEDHLLYVHTNYSQLLRATRTELFERISVLSCNGHGPFSRSGIREAHEAAMAQRAKVLLHETELKSASLARTVMMCPCGRALLRDEIPIEPYEIGQSAPPLPAEAKPLSITERQAEIAAYNLSMSMFDDSADLYAMYESIGHLGGELGQYNSL